MSNPSLNWKLRLSAPSRYFRSSHCPDPRTPNDLQFQAPKKHPTLFQCTSLVLANIRDQRRGASNNCPSIILGLCGSTQRFSPDCRSVWHLSSHARDCSPLSRRHAISQCPTHAISQCPTHSSAVPGTQVRSDAHSSTGLLCTRSGVSPCQWFHTTHWFSLITDFNAFVCQQ